MTTTVDGQGHVIEEQLWDCDSHEFEFKKEYKECLICNKREPYLDDPLETHVHNWNSSGLILEKPKLAVCTLCGKTQYEFDCRDPGDEGFFRYTSEYMETSVETNTISFPRNEGFFQFIKNSVSELESKPGPKHISVPTPSGNFKKIELNYGERFQKWKLKNPDKLSFIRK